MHKKPTGQIGHSDFIHKPNYRSIIWNLIIHPDTKSEIERVYCEKFVQKTFDSLHVIAVIQNQENDFDFTLKTKNGSVYLDLAEIVLANLKGDPYKSDQIEINIGEYVESSLSIIRNKSNLYKTRSTTEKFLLLYITHWRFRPSKDTICLIKHDIKQMDQCFSKIFLYLPIGTDEGEVEMLFPSSIVKQKESDLKQLRSQSFYVLNPKEWKIE